jgi:hypothetical protein
VNFLELSPTTPSALIAAARQVVSQFENLVGAVGFEPTKDAGFKPAAYANSATLPGSGGGRGSRTPRFYPPLVFRTSCQPFSSALLGGRSRDRTCAGFTQIPS